MTTAVELSEDGPVARGRPWSPTGVALITLVLHPLFGGVLHALNWRRLGLPGRVGVTLWTNLLVGALLLLLTLLTPSAGFLRRLIAIFVAIYFYKSQAFSFAHHLASGGRRKSLLMPVVLMVALALAAAVAVAGVELFLLR